MLESELHWTEVLTCSRCGNTGLAGISAGDGPFEDRADVVPSGFTVVPLENGAIKFYCIPCNIPAIP